MEVLLLLLFLLMIPVIATAATLLHCRGVDSDAFILLTLPLAIPMWILAAPLALLREPAL